MLYIFGGLPATGKTELSKFLASSMGAAHIRIILDTAGKTPEQSKQELSELLR
ncbi:hypothetical protein [Agaribacter flavus]|uniref:Uncharacterized protein n=1 Tax=Agaribacter flavus TaxID=1902781 RepID=A0ABV7FU88_9ALTE